MANRLLLLGGGGHCKSVLDCLLQMNQYDDIAIVEKSDANHSPILGVRVIGTDDDLPSLYSAGWASAFITLGSIGSPSGRRRIYSALRNIGFDMPNIIDPSTVIGEEVTLREGIFIGKRAVVNAGTRIGACAIVNTGAIVEHGCTIGDFAHVSPGCTLCGEVSIGENTHVGAGAVVRQGIRIGGNSLIGAGSVVVGNMPNHCKAFGNPCRVVET